MTKPSDTLARLRARSVEAGRFVLPLEPVWADKLTDAYSTLRRAEMAEEGEERVRRLAEAQAVVNDLEASAGDNVMVFHLRRLNRAQYEAMVSRNPPTAEQRKEDEELPSPQRRVFNTTTLPWDLLASVCIDPTLTVEEARDIIQGETDDGAVLLSRGESEALINAAMAAALSVPKALPGALKLP